MPVAFTIRLRTDGPARVNTRHAHGLACSLFEAEDAVHEGAEKPFSIWPIAPDLSRPGHALWQAFWLLPAPAPGGVKTLARVRLGAQPLRIIGVERRVVGHAELTDGAVLREVTLAFRSPVFFSRNGTDDLTPDPRLIFGSYRRRWNGSLGTGNPLAVGDDDWRDTHRFVRLTGYDLATKVMDGGRGRDRTGFVGTATLYLDTAAPRPARAVFSTLARFAPFCGTGAQTTHGFGATELVGSVLAADRPGYG